MRKFNLVKSLTTLVSNITSLPFREGLGLGLGKVRMGLRLLILCLSLATLGTGEVWGAGATWTVQVGVKDGKGGTAKAEIWTDGTFSDTKVTETTETKSSVVSASCSDKTSISHWALDSRYGKFIATAAEGYSFQDWYDTNGTAQNKSTTFSTSASNKNSTWTYYAKFTPNSYTIAFNGNNNTGGSTNSITATYDQNATLPANGFTKTGYTFAGWKLNNTGDTYAAGASVTNLTTTDKATVTFYAQWTANTYQVSFDAGANSTASQASKSVTFDSSYGDLATTTRAGLEGWYTDKTGGLKITKETNVTTANNHTLYARYNYYAKATSLAVSNVEGDAGGGTYISINGGIPSGSSSYIETEDKSTKTIVSYNENPTTASYFAAQAKTGFKFMGWYSDKEHTQLVSSEAIYQPTITVKSNNSSSPTTLSLYAYFEVQWPTYYGKAFSYSVESKTGYTWISMRGTTFSGNFTSDVSDNSHQEGKFASAPSFPCVFYAGPKDGYAFAGWYNNAECIGTPLSTSTTNWCNYNENLTATSTEENNPTTIHRYAKFVPVTVSAATAQTIYFTAQTQTQTATLTFAVTNADAKADFNDPIVTSGDAGWTVKEWNYANNQVTVVVSYTATENTTTKGNHTATVTLTAKSGNSASGQVTAHVAMTPVYTNNIASSYLVETAAIDLNTLWTSTSNGAKHYSIVSFTESGINNEGATAPALNGTTLFLGQAGTINLKLIQDAGTSSVAGTEQTKTITISKHVPTFTWSDAAIYHNQTYSDFFSTNGTNALTVKSSSDDNVAYLEDGSNAQKLNLKTLTKAASTTLTVTQAENYYWAEHIESKTITPNVAPNHVPFTYNEAMFNDGSITKTKEGDCSWQSNGYVRLGGSNTGITDGPAWNWNDKYVILKFDGIPYQLSFEISTNNSSASEADWYIQQSSDGNSWSEVWSETRNSSEWSSTYTKDLNKESRYLKFCYSGNFAGNFRNIKVTELRTFSTDKSSLDFGSNKKDIVCASQTLTFNYANVGHKVTLSTDDNHFSVSPTSITNIGGDTYGTQTITVSYRTDEVHSATNAKLTIKDELGNSKEITLSGSTAKKTQTISWVSPYDVEEPAIPIGKTITGAATSSSNLGVIYESSNSSVIEILNDGTAFKALTTGSATITAKQVGTDDWEQASISKTFKGTNKIIQVISWNQNFTRLLTIYGPQTLTAIVNLENAQTGAQTYSKERSDLITYTSQNSSVVSVNGSSLNIVGKGETTLTASVPGDELYESATVTIPVKVREPSDGCEDVLLGTDFGSGEYEFFHYSLISDMEKVVAIDRSTSAIPGQLSFQHKGKKWGLNYSGEIAVYESTNNGSSWTKLGAVTPSEGTYNTQTYPLSRNATHVKFFRAKSATGYHYIKNVEIVPAQFIESNIANNEIDFGTVTVNSVENKSVTLSYANVKDNLAITKSSSDLSLTCGDIIDLDCGATGTNTFTITFNPKAVGDFSDAIQFSDKNSNKTYTLNIKANVARSTQHITWEPTQTEYRTIDQIELNATASSSYPVKYYVKEGKDVADFVNDVLTIKKDGQITIRAYEPGDAIYEAAVDVDKTFTIRKTNLHFDPLPTAATITYPQTLNESALTDGGVKDEDGNIVAGTIAWTNPTAQLNAGENQSQGITFIPANNPAWYNALSSTTTVSVNKAISTATPSATDITYGQKVNESELTNEGTSGTWTWTDARKNEVLNVGTHEGLQVHFTPSNNNYNELNATVSLTVTKADAQLSWTTAPANVEISETVTYVATSNHTESEITYSITAGADCATIDENTGVLTITKAGTITVQASQAASDNYEAAVLSQTTILTGEFENRFTGDGDWNNAGNWTNGIPTEENPNVVISGSLTITEPISVGDLTIENIGKVNIVDNGDLTVNGTSDDRETYGNLFVRNGGNITINENANVKVYDFVVESSIGTEGTSISGQVKNSDRVIYTNGAYIDIYMDPEGEMDDTQWYGFTVPFPVDVQNGIARKEGDVFRKCTYGVEYMICEYDMTQRLNSGKGWKYIKSGRLQPGRFYYFTVNGNYNVYSFKAADNTITIHNETQLVVNGEGPNANWNAVGNSTLTYTTISGEKVPNFVQTYINGESRYMTVVTDDAQFVVGCPFFFQAIQEATMILNEANETIDIHYAPRQESLDKPVCVRIAEEGKHFSDQIYLTASQETTGKYTLGRDLAKAGIGTKSAQLWINAYNQKLSVHEATLMGEQAYYELSIYAPKAGSYELSLPKVPADAAIYLTQNGYSIWNLNESPYVIECNKGTSNEYGLLLQLQESSTPTNMQTMRGSENVQKILKDQRIYINANTQLYDLMGQKVK